MEHHQLNGWKHFLQGFPWFEGEDAFVLQAYSEYMPPLRTGFSPVTGRIYPWVLSEEDLFGWKVTELAEEVQLRPGLNSIGEQLLEHFRKLGNDTFPVQISGHQNRNLANNIFWTEELSKAVPLRHERYVLMSPLALSKTKDDKGRTPWTFFGASEQGPEKGFWKSFYRAPGEELAVDSFLTLMQWILREGFDLDIRSTADLREAGFRILPSSGHLPFEYWEMKDLPSWTAPFMIGDDDPFQDVKFLLTFRPFGSLPPVVRERYISGHLALFPFPGSLLVWGIPPYLTLQKKLHNAIQIPMLRLVKRHEESTGIRIPQSGWFHQPKVPGEKAEMLEEFITNTYIRTNRWDRVHRHENALLKSSEIDPVAETLFSNTLKSLDLYNKPMARNSQVFNEAIELVLNGPLAGHREIGEAALKVIEGGLFRYRFFFPPMVAGKHEIMWHRPVVGLFPDNRKAAVLAPHDLATGYLTGNLSDHPDLPREIELWPRILRREMHLEILRTFDPVHDHYLHQTPMNLLALLDARMVFGGQRISRELARRLIRIPKTETLEEWIEGLPGRALDPNRAKRIQSGLEEIIESAGIVADLPPALTFHDTANRAYEEAYWHQIHFLAHGEYINKDNADVVLDPVSKAMAVHTDRDLHRLGDYLLKKHRAAIRDAGMDGIAEAGEMPFTWDTDFDFSQFGGWKANQDGKEYERNILVIIPGKNRSEAVIMADHYDTAYMEDVYNTETGGTGARLSAAGADDNHSATATLLLAAPIYLKMSREGKLERDIWLLHLTGEEFPSDCMGARDFCRNYVQKTLRMRKADGSFHDLSGVTVTGLYVMDMIAHNRDDYKDTFQISPGRTGSSLWLAWQAHLVNLMWNQTAGTLNQTPDRKSCGRGKRTPDNRFIPEKALHLELEGEVRTWDDPMSSLYNTDGMIFSDTGIPSVLFMENYDIHRTGYHDTHDTMENIDLDFGSALSAIAIETVARVAALPEASLYRYHGKDIVM